jgi:hypothetical protein
MPAEGLAGLLAFSGLTLGVRRAGTFTGGLLGLVVGLIVGAAFGEVLPPEASG